MAASLGAHALVFPGVARWITSFEARALPTPPPARVVTVAKGQWNKAFELQRPNLPRPTAPQPTPPEAPTPLPPKPPELVKQESDESEKLEGQVVEVPPTQDDSPNPSAKYLGKYNTHVEKETTARLDRRDRSRRNVSNELQTKAPTPPNRPPDAMTPGLAVQGDGKPFDQQPEKGSDQLVLKVPKILEREEVMLDSVPGPGSGIQNQRATDSISGNSDHFELKMGELDTKPGKEAGARGTPDGSEKGDIEGKTGIPTIAALVPNFGTLARISGSPSDDYVPEVAEGEGTFLNTKEFKYATFFIRIKDGVSDYWADLMHTEYRRRDPTGNIYGIRDRTTLIRVALNRAGELDDISIEESSGVDFLDSVAIEAFRRAQPFPNPPSGMADPDGGIRFNFLFHVQMTPMRGSDIYR